MNSLILLQLILSILLVERMQGGHFRHGYVYPELFNKQEEPYGTF